MEIFSFDVCGKLAHFRKYYANNTAFTYSIPPRTTIMGMLAAIMGYERDQYYERLASSRLRVGIRVLKPVKKTFHRLNFLSIKTRGNVLEGTGDFTGAGGHIQTPFEVVSGLDPGRDWLAYRIFIAPGLEDVGEFALIKDALLRQQQRFNLTFGTANFNAWIEKVYLHNQVTELQETGVFSIHSAAPSDKISRLEFKKEEDLNGGTSYLEEELMPADFIGNGNRELSKIIRVLFSLDGKPFFAELNAPVFSVLDRNNGNIQNITFLE
jgi:CRISPR-associated protein Cas5h